jgi:hypothetical protein
MDITETIRKLAKTVEMQNLFSAIRDIPSLTLFKNNTELSLVQQQFLYYLYFYHDIYTDIISDKITDIILKSRYYEDSYYLWRKKSGNKNLKDKPDKPRELSLVFTKGK